ncbi:MAG TPA: efflux transporter outer membrane subunit [Tepidisphaeraceae bacterium]|nr:efflux transporter outer membrane subunit [Tepidisphaeraceae bacterium]
MGTFFRVRGRGFGRPWIALVAGGAMALAGCEVGPNYQSPKVPVPEKFNEAEVRPTTRPAPELAAVPTPEQLKRWWETFHDPELNKLIDYSLRSNLDLQTAAERIVEARAEAGMARAGMFPTVNGTAQYNHSRRSAHLGSSGAVTSTAAGTTSTTGTTTASGGGGSTLEGDFYQAGFDAAWELDVFGGIRRGIEEANANVDAAIEDRRSVLITLLGDVATDYMSLRGLQAQVAITVGNISTQQQTLNLIETQNRAGLVADLAVAQQEAQLMTTKATLPDLEAEIDVEIHALGVLLDLEPSALEAELAAPGPIPFGPVHIPPGLPSELLRRRPDIREAERQLAASSAEIGVAISQLYPQFSLTGSLGYESSQFHQLFNLYSRYFSLGPSVNWPIFNAGQIEYNVQVENSLERQAFINYESTVLTGFQEVEDSLITYAKEQDRRAELQDAVVADQKAVDLTQSLYKEGLDTFLDVLTTQQTLLTAQQSLVTSEQAVSTDLVSLYKALGGGWETTEMKDTD